MGKYVAIDIGGTNIKYGLIDDTDTLLEAHEIPTEAHKGGPEILHKVKGIVARYLEQIPVAGVCISSAGMVDPDKGEIFYAGPQIPNYAGSQLCWLSGSHVREWKGHEYCDLFDDWDGYRRLFAGGWSGFSWF